MSGMTTRPPLRSAQSAPDLDILGDEVKIHPGGYIAPASQRVSQDNERNLVGNMARFRESPLDFFKEISLHVSGLGWRAYDRVIGQPIFYAGFSEEMSNKVLNAPMLRARIQGLAEHRINVEKAQGLFGEEGSMSHARLLKRKNEIEESLQEVALDMIDNMICKMESKTFIRSAYYICTQLLTRAYDQGIHVSSEEVLRLRAVAEQAAAKKQSIIFLPCHRSHIDYVSLQIICYRLGIALPTVVAGDNLNFPVVGSFLQHAGAMWIRRSFGNDAFYTTIVQSYIDTLLQNGFNFECFIEGGRSRIGKLLAPKFGILSFLLDSLLSGRVEDAIICPVSTQYDKVIETESYINELLGHPKAKENLQDFLSASSILSLKLGRVDVRFHEPWSLREFITEQIRRVDGSSIGNSLSPPLPIHLKPEQRTRMLRTLGYKVLSEINDVSVVMPTALIGTVLLTLRGRGVGKSELIRRVEWLSDRVHSKGGRVAHFAGLPTETVVDRGLDVLGPELVKSISNLPEQTFCAVDRFQLAIYRNMTIHLFISEALVSAAMYSKVKQGGGPEDQSITFDTLYDQVNFLSQLFRGEFIYPTVGLLRNLVATLEGLERDGVVKLVYELPNEQGSRVWRKIQMIELSEQERACGRENFDFYCFLIWPFIESMWLGSVFLMALTTRPISSDYLTEEGEIWWDLVKAQDTAQLLGKTLYHQGDLDYFEAVNKENLKNCFNFFEEEGIVVMSKTVLPNLGKNTNVSSKGSQERRDQSSTQPLKSLPASKPTSLVRLSNTWMPPRDPETARLVPQKSRLWIFIETIALSRREGKNRRDNATVSTRVLDLADRLAEELVPKIRILDGQGVTSATTVPSIEMDECALPGEDNKTGQRHDGRTERERKQGRLKRRKRTKGIEIKARL